MMRLRLIILAPVLYLTCLGNYESSHPVERNARITSPSLRGYEPVQIQMNKVNFRLSPDIVLEVSALRGELRRTRSDVPVTFDDSSSFEVFIDTAEVAITTASLSALMNSFVFAGNDAPVRNISMEIDGDHLIEKGSLHKGVWMPFEITAAASVTADGNVRLHAEKIRAAHVPVKGLMHLFGENLAKMMGDRTRRGLIVQNDDLILLLPGLTPPPHLHGHATHVQLVNGRIVEAFDSGRHLPALDAPYKRTGYIYHRGGTLRFGKLTMNDTELEIVGTRPGTFDFFQREYLKQLVAGYSKTTPNDGLVTHMADYSQVAGSAAVAVQQGADTKPNTGH